ncbi:MAG: FAD:protein FMN transferase [Actinobacteria bacterium]|nr:FAD:protein FMN transferase [Actinomycetota bacterium]
MAVTAASLPVLGHRFDVMGSAAEVTLVGGDAEALSAAVARLHQLDRRWSRFRSDSEIARINADAGRPVPVSPETVLLVDLARQGWRRTGGRYDPTLLAAVRRAGYTDDFARLAAVAAPPPAEAADHDPGTCGRIIIDEGAGTVELPDRSGFDPGGIGKGLAADLVSADLATRGIPGGCVNIGGDLRLWGPGPRGDRWRVSAADRTISVTDAGVATSGTGRRTWVVAGRRMHHLIDPTTLDPANTGVTAVTVIAPAAWQAEVYALAALLSGPARACADLRRWGVDGLVVQDCGRVRASRRLRRRP